jgi:hypothetical protein
MVQLVTSLPATPSTYNGSLGVGVYVGVAVPVRVAVALRVGVRVIVGVRDGLAVGVTVGVRVAVPVRVGVPDGKAKWHVYGGVPSQIPQYEPTGPSLLFQLSRNASNRMPGKRA